MVYWCWATAEVTVHEWGVLGVVTAAFPQHKVNTGPWVYLRVYIYMYKQITI